MDKYTVSVRFRGASAKVKGDTVEVSFHDVLPADYETIDKLVGGLAECCGLGELERGALMSEVNRLSLSALIRSRMVA